MRFTSEIWFTTDTSIPIVFHKFTTKTTILYPILIDFSTKIKWNILKIQASISAFSHARTLTFSWILVLKKSSSRQELQTSHFLEIFLKLISMHGDLPKPFSWIMHGRICWSPVMTRKTQSAKRPKKPWKSPGFRNCPAPSIDTNHSFCPARCGWRNWFNQWKTSRWTG